FVYYILYILSKKRLQEKEFSKSPLLKGGLIYLEMMFLSYGGIILTSCIPLRGLSQQTTPRKRVSSESFVERRSNLPGDDVS
ncbi:MAG: hypothetical protein ACYCQJ_14395, partial [Nitrososphaerales archaeon]